MILWITQWEEPAITYWCHIYLSLTCLKQSRYQHKKHCLIIIISLNLKKKKIATKKMFKCIKNPALINTLRVDLTWYFYLSLLNKSLKTLRCLYWCQNVSCTLKCELSMLYVHVLPIQTSPKQPWPSLSSRRRDSRGISHASLARPWVWGFTVGHTAVSR